MSETITITSNSGELSVVVARANGYANVRRSIMTARAANDNASETDEVMQMLRSIAADIIPPVVEHEGFPSWPPTIEDLAAVDGMFLDRWADAVYKLNPAYIGLPEAEAQKKA